MLYAPSLCAGMAEPAWIVLMISRSIELSGRDLSIVQLIARFKQLSSSHVHNFLFHDKSTRTPTDRALRRLVASGFLAKIERRTVGGARGGSGQFVYQLGRRGYFMHFEGRYSPWRAVNYHALAIADSYLVAHRLALSGEITVAGFSTEPDCWVSVGRFELRPDLYLDLQNRSGALKLWLEVDMATEGQGRIKEKLERYWKAYNDVDVEQWPVFPRIVFVAIDAERERELKWIIEQGPKEAQALFQVTAVDKLAPLLIN